MQILLVDDETELTVPLAKALHNQGYEVTVAHQGQEGKNLAEQGGYDLLILDWILPQCSGLEICQTIRRKGDRTPILMLTARDTLDDRVIGLDSGADDYLVKPFELRELLARVRALLRRVSPSEHLRYGDLELDVAGQVVYVQGQPISLSDKETQLLAYLMSHPQQLLTHAEITNYLWGEHPPASNALTAQIRLLRKKIDSDRPTSLINTVYGKGYRFG